MSPTTAMPDVDRSMRSLVVMTTLCVLVCTGCESQQRDVLVPSSRASSGDARLEIAFAGVDQNAGDGPIQVALWSSASTFMREGAWVRALTIPIADASCGVTIGGVEPGEYALSAFHDTANSGRFRRGPLGFPVDPWAVSNGGPAWLPPTWNRAHFNLPAGTTRIELDFSHTEDVTR